MKRYWLFKFPVPGSFAKGGMHDFDNSFDTFDETKAYIKETQEVNSWSIYGDYYQIVDSTNGEIVYESNERLQ